MAEPTASVVAIAATEVARRRALEEAARGYVAASKAPNTLRAYRSDLRDFEEWCAPPGRCPPLRPRVGVAE